MFLLAQHLTLFKTAAVASAVHTPAVHLDNFAGEALLLSDYATLKS
jgi:hypothetical protein